MNLWFSCALLVAGMIFSTSAQITDECTTMVNPLPKFDLSVGRWNFIAGYINTEPFLELFKTVQSMWIIFREGETTNTFVEHIGIRHTTYCKYGKSQGLFFRNSGIIHKSNFTCTYHSLPTCQDCLLYHVDSINNKNLVLINNPTDIQQVPNYQAFYLMSRFSHVADSDLEHFKNQAHCVGFEGEPTFIYDKKDTYCEEEFSDL